jgi:hypothetical protein
MFLSTPRVLATVSASLGRVSSATVRAASTRNLLVPVRPMTGRKSLAAALTAAVLIGASVAPSYAQSVASPVPLAGEVIVQAPQPCDPGASVPAGYNVIVGGAGNDVLVGTPGNDLIRGMAGDDYLFGNEGNDILCGGDGSDRLYGGPGRDRMWGGNGADSAYGESGDDDLFGDANNDTLDGGSGKDFCWGGLGADAIAVTCETVLP